ncbi:MAG: YheT family hydrolase [Flavobacteriales bacterium]
MSRFFFMPILQSKYNPKWIFRNMHISTIWASQFRKTPKLKLNRIQVELKDGDFIHLDSHLKHNKKLVLLLHGLEGHSLSKYMQSMAQIFINSGYDAILMNHRSCSGVDNRLYSCYHSGKSDDLNEIITYINKTYDFNSINLVGFSLGGNVCLKYLGEHWNKPSNLKACVSISPPIDLEACGKALNQPKNWIYAQTFLRTMRKKLRLKLEKFPENNNGQMDRVKNLHDFDNEYTGPAHGFGNAQGYYDHCSSKDIIKNIKLPTYILIAQNDSFMQKPCYPYSTISNMENVFLETPKYGGHVGFVLTKGNYHHENVALDFILENQ